MWQILELVTHRGETPLIKRDLGTSQWFFSKLVTNCKGPHTINTANVGSTRDPISQNKMCIKAKDCKADTDGLQSFAFSKCQVGTCVHFLWDIPLPQDRNVDT